MALEITHVKMELIEPNPWNPNKQSEREYAAEIESILDNGFIAPILVRKVGDGYQIVDGEHRWKAMKDIRERGLTGKGNVVDLILQQEIPTVVLDISEAKAKKLTIIMNETRGKADLAGLGTLLAEIKVDFPDDLLLGLPYTEAQIAELMEIGDFNWDDYDGGAKGEDFDHSGANGFALVSLLDEETEKSWKAFAREFRDDLPEDTKQANGSLISHLLGKAGY